MDRKRERERARESERKREKERERERKREREKERADRKGRQKKNQRESAREAKRGRARGRKRGEAHTAAYTAPHTAAYREASQRLTAAEKDEMAYKVKHLRFLHAAIHSVERLSVTAVLCFRRGRAGRNSLQGKTFAFSIHGVERLRNVCPLHYTSSALQELCTTRALLYKSTVPLGEPVTNGGREPGLSPQHPCPYACAHVRMYACVLMQARLCAVLRAYRSA